VYYNNLYDYPLNSENGTAPLGAKFVTEFIEVW